MLVHGNIEVRLYSRPAYRNRRSYVTGLVFQCEDARYWFDRLKSEGLAPALTQDGDQSLSVGCHVTDDVTVTIEQLGH